MYSNLNDQSLTDDTQTGMPASIRARLARFSEEQAAEAVVAPVEQQYCTRAEMETLRYEMQMRMDEAIKAVIPPYSTADMIDHACRPLRDEIAGLKDDLGNVCRALGRYAISECGEVPESDLLTYLKCQVWHSPWLTKDEQKIKSIWSFRVSVEVRHHRLPEEINVRLFPVRQFYKTAKKPAMRTESVIQACEYFLDNGGDDAWAGFIQGFTRKKGRPYVKDQVGFIHGHQSDVSPMATKARVSFLLGGKLHSFSSVRPSNGDAGSSLWWCEWRAGEPSTNEPSA